MERKHLWRTHFQWRAYGHVTNVTWTYVIVFRKEKKINAILYFDDFDMAIFTRNVRQFGLNVNDLIHVADETRKKQGHFPSGKGNY